MYIEIFLMIIKGFPFLYKSIHFYLQLHTSIQYLWTSPINSHVKIQNPWTHHCVMSKPLPVHTLVLPSWYMDMLSLSSRVKQQSRVCSTFSSHLKANMEYLKHITQKPVNPVCWYINVISKCICIHLIPTPFNNPQQESKFKEV